MKLTAKTIPDFLKSPGRVLGALIYGPDEGLVRERAGIIAAAILGPHPDPLQRVDCAEEALKADPALLADALCAYSLMGGRQVVTARADGDWLASRVEAALEGPTPPNYLIIQAGELSPRAALRKLFEASPKLAALPCYADEAGDIARLLRAALAEASISAEAGVPEYLASQLGNDRQVTRSEIDKVVLYAGPGGRLTLEDARGLVGHNRELSLEDIALAAADGDFSRLDAHLQQAWRESAPPVVVFRSVLRHFHRLYLARIQVEGGVPAEQAVAALKPPVFFRQAPQLTRQVSRWAIADIARALSLAAEGEAASKSASGSPALCAHTLFMIAGRGRALAQPRSAA